MRHLGSDGQELQTLAFIYEEIDAELDQALREQEAKVGVNYICCLHLRSLSIQSRPLRRCAEQSKHTWYWRMTAALTCVVQL